MYPEDYKELIGFHGHSCPGLALGYRVVKAAVDRADIKKAGDEEVVAIVENDSCSVDAVQFLLGCTFGKGNLIFKDHGKQVFTFARRTTEKGIRVSLLPDVLDAHDGLTGEEKQRMRERLVKRILDMPEEELLNVEEVRIDLPGKAQIHSSVACDFCGEPMMETKMVEKGGKFYCIPCAGKLPKEPA